MSEMPKRSKVFNVPIDLLSYESALTILLEWAVSKNKHFIFTPNVHHIYLVNKSNSFKEAYDKCSLSLIDGIPLIWVLRNLFGIQTEKISGSDMFVSLFKKAYDQGLKIFLLGGGEGIAERAAENLRVNSSKSKSIACLSPYLGFESDSIAKSQIIQTINEFNPNILFVAFGSPKGELWIHQNFENLKANIVMGIGGSIDFAAGVQKRAPKVIQQIGLEWFYRLCCNPRRLFNRYLASNSFFIWLVIKTLTKKCHLSTKKI